MASSLPASWSFGSAVTVACLSESTRYCITVIHCADIATNIGANLLYLPLPVLFVISKLYLAFLSFRRCKYNASREAASLLEVQVFEMGDRGDGLFCSFHGMEFYSIPYTAALSTDISL